MCIDVCVPGQMVVGVWSEVINRQGGAIGPVFHALALASTDIFSFMFV